ncbi:hypothetical protein HOG98_08755 [bacterium]|jgi:hypothetical protein|nr:hypothetical protein [bacterium]
MDREIQKITYRVLKKKIVSVDSFISDNTWTPSKKRRGDKISYDHNDQDISPNKQLRGNTQTIPVNLKLNEVSVTEMTNRLFSNQEERLDFGKWAEKVDLNLFNKLVSTLVNKEGFSKASKTKYPELWKFSPKNRSSFYFGNLRTIDKHGCTDYQGLFININARSAKKPLFVIREGIKTDSNGNAWEGNFTYDRDTKKICLKQGKYSNKSGLTETGSFSYNKQTNHCVLTSGTRLAPYTGFDKNKKNANVFHRFSGDFKLDPRTCNSYLEKGEFYNCFSDVFKIGIFSADYHNTLISGKEIGPEGITIREDDRYSVDKGMNDTLSTMNERYFGSNSPEGKINPLD